MDSITIFPLAEALGWTILHSFWQFAVVGILAWLGLRILPQSKPNFRYIALLSCILVALIWFSVTFMHQIETASPPVQEAVQITVNHIGEVGKETFSVDEYDWFNSPDRFDQYLGPIVPYLSYGWFVGVLLSFFYMLLGVAHLYHLKTHEVYSPSADWMQTFNQLKLKMGINKQIDFLLSDLVDGPITFQLAKPVILVPAALFTGFPPAQMEALLLHELAHIRRYDFVVNIFQGLIETLFFYHPAIWWISSKVRDEREHCCDNLVVAKLQDPFTYANALTQVQLTHSSFQKRLAMSANHHKGLLSKRIFRLFGKYDQQPSLFKSAFLVVALLLFFSSSNFWASVPVTLDSVELEQVAQDTLPQGQKVKPDTKNTEQLARVKKQKPDTKQEVRKERIQTEEVEIETSDETIEIKGLDDENPPLLVLDGERKGAMTSDLDQQLDPDDIAYINVIKGEQAIQKYGQEGTYGVVEVWTKGYESEESIELLKEGEESVRIMGLEGKMPPIWYLDGEEQGLLIESIEESLSPDEISFIRVTKGKDAEAVYGEKGKNGIVEVWTKDKHDEILVEPIDPQQEVFIRELSKGKEPIYIVDGVVSDSIKIDPKNIKTIDVRKGGSKLHEDGEQEETDVIEIWTKEEEETEKSTLIVVREPEDKNTPLYVLDGKILGRDSKVLREGIKPEDIESIDVIKGDHAVEQYGNQGKHGVIEIHTKKDKKKAKKAKAQKEAKEKKKAKKEKAKKEAQESQYKKQQKEKDKVKEKVDKLKEERQQKLKQRKEKQKAKEEKKRSNQESQLDGQRLSVGSPSQEAASVALQVFPNPSRGQVNIQFNLKEEKDINLRVYTLDGKLVKSIAQQKQQVGPQQFIWQAESQAKGTYLIKLEVDTTVYSKQVVVE